MAIIICLLVAANSPDARADESPRTHRREPPSTADLDGFYVAVGPMGAVARIGDAWDGGFGAELSLARVRERQALAAAGVTLGGLRYAERGDGRVWAEAFVGTKRLLGVAIGISVGATARVDRVVPPRYGAQTSVWVFAGVIPYVRVGAIEREGNFIEAGVRVALPALRL